MLETAMEELFMPYTEGQKYIDRESKSLTELYANLLINFTQFHVSLAPLSRLSLTESLCQDEDTERERKDNHV